MCFRVVKPSLARLDKLMRSLAFVLAGNPRSKKTFFDARQHITEVAKEDLYT